jgi:hypothetical protein
MLPHRGSVWRDMRVRAASRLDTRTTIVIKSSPFTGKVGYVLAAKH